MESRAAYDVFLNYMVEDSLELVDPLYHRMIDFGLSVFREDDELSSGKEISPSLLQAIQNSKIYIPIFSKKYASSSWCLRELAYMVRLRSESDGEKQILPIFYDVQPPDVELRTSLYDEELQELTKSLGSDDLGQWRDALIEAAKTNGCVWDGNPKSLGSLVISVVEELLHRLKASRHRSFPERLVGMDVRVSKVINLLDVGGDGVHFLGILGMGGLGKTVLAMAVFNELRSRFEGCSFVEDIRECSSQRAGLVTCQKKLLSDIIQSEPPSFNSIGEGRMFIRQRLANKKVLLVLDDIDHKEQLKALAGDIDWFGRGSRIIITTRNSRILHLAYPTQTYEMGILNNEEAFNLFSTHAFGRSFPPEDYYALSREAVFILGGLPLALEVTGSLLCGKSKAIWQDTLKKLKVTPLRDIQVKLKISYDALEYEQKQIFLDMACFFIGKDVTDAIYMWDDCGFFPRQAIDELVATSLIKIADDHTIFMHEQLRDLGREIVRQENPKDPRSRSRVWHREEALHVFGQTGKDLEHVEALSLVGNPAISFITDKEFARLPNLRFLELERATLGGDFNNLLQELRYLSWRFCPGGFTATNMHLESLVVLSLSEGHITDDWGGWSRIKARKLKVLDLTGCQRITKTPDLSAFSSLERLLLCDCLELRTMDSSIARLRCLTYLNLKGCINLQGLPEEIGALENLDYLCLEGCSKITELPSELGYLKALRELNISGTGIQVLPDSLGKLKKLRVIRSEKDKSSLLSARKLKVLDLTGCQWITKMPDLSAFSSLERLLLCDCLELHTMDSSIARLRCLTYLNLKGCINLQGLPEEIGALENLDYLCLEGCSKITELPSEMGYLKALRELNISDTGIQVLPDSLGKLKKLRVIRSEKDKSLLLSARKLKVLDLTGGQWITKTPDLSAFSSLERLLLCNCLELRTMDNSIARLRCLTYLNLKGCINLQGLPEEIGALENLEYLCLEGCSKITELPSEMGYLKALRELNILDTGIQVLPNSLGKLKKLRVIRSEKDKSSLLSARKLKVLDLTGCQWITKTPDLSAFSSLERLLLCDCLELRTMDSSIARLRCLTYLNLKGCINLQGLPEEIGALENLDYLCLEGCSKITELPSEMGYLKALRELNISDTGIQVLPDSLGKLKKLRVIRSEKDKSSLLSARKLKVLDLTGCQWITKTPDLSAFSSLEWLLLCNCLELRTMDSSIARLRCLTYLNLKGCINLQGLPEEIGALENLDYLCLEGCSKITELPSEMGYLKALRELNISDTGIQVLPDSLGKLKKLRVICSEKDKSSLLSAEEPKRTRDELSEKLEGVNPNRKGTHYREAVLGTVDWDSGSDLARRPGKMSQMELQGSVNLEKSMEKMKDEAGQRPEDMETSDRNYAIAAVRNLVGIDGRVKQITDLLEMEVNDEVHILGIFGTNGIGKTTLAKAVYDRMSSSFDGCSFLAEVEETTQDPSGIQVLQTRLIHDILERDREDSSFDERIEDFLDIFRERKVLLVIDDVEEKSHLRAIVGDQLHRFGPGSRIIVTSENEEILKEYDPEKARTYSVSALVDGQAFELFCMHAFWIQSSRPDYDGLANGIVNAMEKLPLAVEVVGSFLRGKSIQEWAKMEKSMKERTRSSRKTMVGPEEILDICCKELDQQQKDIFLDIACFISGVDARIASYMWPNCHLPSSGCILMPLAKTGENNELLMHRLLRCLGKRICKQEESQDPRSRRFCTQDMVLKAMNREKGMGSVEVDFTAGDFQSMPKLRFLKLDNARVSGNFAGAFASLRWLCWQRCPPEFDAENLELRELAILELPRGKITEDWGGWSKIKMPKLKVLNLTGCCDLLFTPDFSRYKDLEILILEGCYGLVKLDPSIGHLKRLVSLNLKSCSQLNVLPVELGDLTALEELFIDGTSVREIPISIGNLKKLEILSGFECSPLTHLPRSIIYLTALFELSFDSAKITELPSSLGDLFKLRRLSLRNCRYLEELPDSIGRMGSLEELNITGTRIAELPRSIGNMESLKVLRMDSSFIRAFRREIGNLTKLEELHASWCRSLKGALPSDIKGLHRLRSLMLGHSRISSLPSEISTIPGLHNLDLIQCNEIIELPKLPPSLIRLRVSSKRMKAIALKDLKELEELCLSDGDLKARRPPSAIEEIEGLERLKALKRLDISNCRIRNLDGIGQLTSLRSLILSDCDDLDSLPDLSNLKSLKVLEIRRCKVIHQIEGIKELTSLKKRIIIECPALKHAEDTFHGDVTLDEGHKSV